MSISTFLRRAWAFGLNSDAVHSRAMEDRDERKDLPLEREPNQSVGRPVVSVSGDPIRLHPKALLGAVEHLAHGTNFGGLVRPACVYIHDDAVVRIDQVIVRIGKESRAFARCGLLPAVHCVAMSRKALAGGIGMRSELGLDGDCCAKGFVVQRVEIFAYGTRCIIWVNLACGPILGIA